MVEFHLASNSLTLPTVQHLRKVVPRMKVPPSGTSSLYTDSVTLSWVILTLLSPLTYYNGLKNSKMSKQGTAGRRKEITSIVARNLK
jgi:hypothetical protein